MIVFRWISLACRFGAIAPGLLLAVRRQSRRGEVRGAIGADDTTYLNKRFYRRTRSR